MKLAAIYVRVSTQRQKEEATIDSQKELLLQFAKNKGFEISPDWIFEDNGISGSTLDRPALDKLRDYAAEGFFDHIFVLSPDRLSRKYAYQAILIDEFKSNHVTLVFQNSPSPQTPADNLLLQMQGMFAEYERAQIAERSRRGKKHKARNGHVSVLSQAPYGYRYIKGDKELSSYFEIIEREALVVRTIFDLYVKERLSISKIIKYLSSKQLKTAQGNSEWSRSSINNVLNNSTYQGIAYYGKREKSEPDPMRLAARRVRLKGRYRAKKSHIKKDASEWISIPVPAIINCEIFELAQELLAKNKKQSLRNSKPGSLLQGLISCKECGYGFISVISGKKSKGYSYYRCNKRERNCKNPGIHMANLDEAVWNSIVSMLSTPELIQNEVTRRLKDLEKAPLREQQRLLDGKLEKLEIESNRLLDAYQNECIDLSELKQRMERIKREKNNILRELEQSQEGLSKNKLLELNEAINQFSKHLNDSEKNLSFEEKRKILRMLIQEIQIGKDGIKIEHIIPVKKKFASDKIACLCTSRQDTKA